MAERSLDDVLGDFDPKEKNENGRLGRSITIWLPEGYKEKYDQIQAKHSRKFAAKLRELIIIAIEKTASKAVKT